MDSQLKNAFFPMIYPEAMFKLEVFTTTSTHKLNKVACKLIRKQSKKHAVPACYIYSSICMCLLAITEQLLTIIQENDPLVGEAVRDQIKDSISKW